MICDKMASFISKFLFTATVTAPVFFVTWINWGNKG